MLKHPVRQVLAQCRREWVQRWLWLLVVAGVVCWLPVAMLAVVIYDGLALVYGWPHPPLQSVANSQLIATVILAPAYVAQPLAFLIAALAAARSLRVPDELLAATGEGECYSAVRASARGAAYLFNGVYLLLPSLATFSLALVPDGFSDREALAGYIALMIVFIVHWFSYSEITLFVALRFMHWHVAAQVAMALLLCAPLALISQGAETVTAALGIPKLALVDPALLLAPIAVAAAIAFFCANRNPPRGFTEKLAARN